MKPRQDTVGVGERQNSFNVGLNPGAGKSEQSNVVCQHIEIRPGSAAAETQRRSAGIDYLGDYRAGWPAHGRWIAPFNLLRRFR